LPFGPRFIGDAAPSRAIWEASQQGPTFSNSAVAVLAQGKVLPLWPLGESAVHGGIGELGTFAAQVFERLLASSPRLLAGRGEAGF
jgi:hypothetical protein